MEVELRAQVKIGGSDGCGGCNGNGGVKELSY